MFVQNGGLTYLCSMFTLFDKTTIDTHSLNSKSLLLILKLILYMISTKLYSVVEDKLQEETYG